MSIYYFNLTTQVLVATLILWATYMCFIHSYVVTLRDKIMDYYMYVYHTTPDISAWVYSRDQPFMLFCFCLLCYAAVLLWSILCSSWAGVVVRLLLCICMFVSVLILNICAVPSLLCIYLCRSLFVLTQFSVVCTNIDNYCLYMDVQYTQK